MIHGSSYKQQIKILGSVLIFVFGGAIVLLFAIGLLRVVAGVDIGELTRDPIHKTGLHPFVGFLSNLGVLLWAFTAATCFFTAVVLRRSGRSRGIVSFFLIAGAITTWMMIDDLFLFHDVIFREYLGIPEAVSYPFYAAGVAIFFYVYREQVRNSEYVLLFLAAGSFLLSMSFDIVIDQELIPGSYLFEDGFKFLGIIAWLLYFTRAGFAEVMASRSSGRRTRMLDGVCSRCGSMNVHISRGEVEPEVPVIPLAAIHRYEKPAVIPMNKKTISITCNDCQYSEFYINESTKLVSVKEERRRAG